MSADTPQQAHILRAKAAGPARAVRRQFPTGTRVAARRSYGTPLPDAQTGTVLRHVPALNALGGYLLVHWDSGHVGRVSAPNLTPLEDS